MKKWLWLVPMAAWAAGFAPDQRHLAPNRAPFTALARTRAHGGLGCGTLVGSDLLLTCAHCVSNERRELYDDVEIELGLGFETTSRVARVKRAFFADGSNGEIDAGQDWAVVQLDRPLGAYYGWLRCRYLSDSEWSDQEIELLGYCACPDEARPQFGWMDRPYRCPGAVSDVGPEIVFHNCAMWGGTSGAPLLARVGESYAVVGINFASVSVEGETLRHGFRDTYKKELANLAIPGRNWRTALEQVSLTQSPVLKSLSVNNATPRILLVKTHYHSVFSAPGETAEAQVAVSPGQRRALLTRQEGCLDDELTLNIVGRKPLTQKLSGAETSVTIR